MVSTSTTVSASYATKRSRSPERSPPQKKITLRVKTQQDGGEDIYKIGENAHLKKLMDAYCKKRNIERKTVRFIYNGKEIKPRQTPAQLKMEEDDPIDIVTDQGGG